MPTLREIRAEMVTREAELGRVADVASLTTTTAVVTALATGTVSAGKYSEKWLLRPSTANVADRVRVSSTFASATGTLTHAGTNYADTTATSEQIEILEHEPYLFDQAIQRALGTTRRVFAYEMPSRPGLDRYSLADQSWITDAGDVARVYRRGSPLLTRNRHFEHWNAYSSGALVPDDWTLAGSGATFARSTTTRGRTPYALGVTRSGTNATVTQAYDVVLHGVSSQDIRSETVTGVLVGRSGAGSSLTVTVRSLDAAGNVLSSNASDAHDGDDDWQELSVEHTVHAAAETLEGTTR